MKDNNLKTNSDHQSLVEEIKPSICFVGLSNLPVLAKEYNHLGIGGAELQQTLLAKAIACRGFNVSMIVGDLGQEDGRIWDEVKTFKAFPASAGIPIIKFIHPRWTKMWSALKKANADIYHVTCAGMHVGLVALFTQMYGKKFIYRVAHDDDCDKRTLRIEHWRDKLLFNYGINRAAAVTVQNDYQKIKMKENYGSTTILTQSLMETCNNLLSYDDRELDILWVNNIRDFKRPDILIELSKELKLNIHMIGGKVSGFAKLYSEVEAASSINNYLKFYGPIPYHDINEFYRRAKIFVNTSDTEGFPNSYLQAWERGTPVVAFYDPDGVIMKEGLGKKVNNFEEMKEAILYYYNNKTAWLATSKRVKEYMKRKYNQDHILELYENIFKTTNT